MSALVRETVRLAGGREQAVLRGGRGPVLVWLHGLGGVTPDDPAALALAERWSVVAPVAPGFDRDEDAADLRGVHDLALRADDLFEALGLEGALVAGHSFGAMLAAELAAHAPRRVARLLLVSPLGWWRDDEPAADFFAVPPGSDASPYRRTPPEAVERARRAVARVLWPLPDKGLRRRLYRVRARSVVLSGDRDPFVPASYARDLAAGLGGAPCVVEAGAGHDLPYERPDAVAAALDALRAA
ncbi:MAG: alpha/beta fold hydrolase [Elusimicrobiota bacterium]|nr:alpha/beta fold hydrolase [Elusimicrobiota bacterium]